MVKRSSGSAGSGTYFVRNPRNIAPPAPVFTCVEGCAESFFAGDLFDHGGHPHARVDRLIKLGILEACDG